MSFDREILKRTAAVAAVAEVRNGMALGLGTGSTMAFALDELARRIRIEGLRVACVPTSARTELRARELDIPLISFAEIEMLDLAIDGADELLPQTLTLIKGRGGALLRERIVAAVARQLLIIVDRTKVAEQFASLAPVPVEVVPFGHETTARRIAQLGLRPILRVEGGTPVVTDGFNLLYDCCGVAPGTDPEALETQLRRVIGVVDSGIFVGMATSALIGETPTSVRRLRRCIC